MTSIRRTIASSQRNVWKIFRLKTKSVSYSTSTVDIDKIECTKLVDYLQYHTSTLISSSSQNLVAFSGGVDSSLVAYLIHQGCQNTTPKAQCEAVLGVSSSLSSEQMALARIIAEHIGISLREVSTLEGEDPTYIQNQGNSCYVCKTNLYSTMTAISHYVSKEAKRCDVLLFNGTNKDDVDDSTRVGLVAAKEFQVLSPLIKITKSQVRQASKHLSLPNWNYAASPCLRSRIEFGVEATKQHLLVISKAEKYLRQELKLKPDVNLRVRLLSGSRARIELDSHILESLSFQNFLQKNNIDSFFHSLGFFGGVNIRKFKSGNLARRIPEPLTSGTKKSIEIELETSWKMQPGETNNICNTKI